MNSTPGRLPSAVSLPDPLRKNLKSYMSSYEISRFVQKCQKEREDALRREESARNKLQHLEISTHSQIQELRQRLKEATSENKTLQRIVKKLRVELGLESNPRFKGKTIKDIIKKVHEQEDQISWLKQDNHLLSLQIHKLSPDLAHTQKERAELHVQLEINENKLQELEDKNSQLSQLLQESERQRQEVERDYLMLKKSIEEAKQLTNRSIQTITSIPVTLNSSFKKPSRDTPSLERRKASFGTRNILPVTGTSTSKPYYSTVHQDSATQKASAKYHRHSLALSSE